MMRKSYGIVNKSHKTRRGPQCADPPFFYAVRQNGRAFIYKNGALLDTQPYAEIHPRLEFGGIVGDVISCLIATAAGLSTIYLLMAALS